MLDVSDGLYPSPVPRRGLYTYATWLSKAMAGEHQCHYAGWYKSHYKVRARRDIDLDAWNAEHNVMVQDAAAEYRRAGFEVFFVSQSRIAKVYLRIDHSWQEM